MWVLYTLARTTVCIKAILVYGRGLVIWFDARVWIRNSYLFSSKVLGWGEKPY